MVGTSSGASSAAVSAPPWRKFAYLRLRDLKREVQVPFGLIYFFSALSVRLTGERPARVLVALEALGADVNLAQRERERMAKSFGAGHAGIKKRAPRGALCA